jgi:hypothetical protein
MSEIRSWKTSFKGLYKPPKVVPGYATSMQVVEYWPYASSDSDPYWSGGSNPVAYKYRVTFTFEETIHGSHITRTPFRYNGQDIEVGDFVAGAEEGKVLQVVSISYKDDQTVIAIIEDKLRYNVYKTGTSAFNIPGNVIFFTINELGMPMLDPLPNIVSGSFYANVMSRFQYLNPLTNFVIAQDGHSFEKGDAVCIESGEFVRSTPDNINYFVGTVVEPGPGPNQFILRPANGIIDFVPALPGNVGDYIYPNVDGSGDLTTDDSSQRPILMKISDAVPTYTIGTAINPTGSAGDKFEINKIMLTMAASYDLDDAIDAINNETTEHKITADKVPAPTNITSNISIIGSSYGVIAGYAPFSASINGVTVNFTTTAQGSITFSDPTVANVDDMVVDINAANIPNIVASVDSDGDLVITNQVGGEIALLNITNDTNGNGFAGPNGLASVDFYAAPNTGVNSVLRLTRADGGPMTLRDYQGSFFQDSGVMSGQNGQYALGLQIEQGLRSSTTTVVPTIASRDGLYPLIGDQAYVLDDGNGEWALFVWDGSNWISVSTERSNANDARTVVTTFDEVALGTSITTEQSLGYVTADRTITEVVVLVTDAFPAGTTIKVGTSANPDLLFAQQDARLYETGSYSTDPEYRTSGYQEIIATLSRITMGSGEVTVIINYS